MDTQRLILFVVFSFSALLLWEAWQKEFRPPPPAVATSPAKSTAPADLPQVPTAAPPAPTAGTLPAAPVPPGAGQGTRGCRPHRDDCHRPLSGGDRHHGRRHHAGRAAQASRSGRRGEALSRAHQDAGAHVRRAVGTAGRRHAEPSDRLHGASRARASLRRAADRLELKLQAVAPNGDQIVQVLTFHRGTYVIDVAYDDHECRRRADRAVRLLPVHARHQDAGHAELDGAGLVCRPGHLQRDRQVQEGRIRRSRQARRRSFAQAPVTPRTPTTAGSRWWSTTSSPHGCRATRRRRRASSTRASSTAASTRRG